jgi:L-iditol 2-dehydrogenase
MEPAFHCGNCEFCLAGRHNVCPTTRFKGSNSADGFFLDYVTIPVTNVLAVPDSMSYAQATVIEPLAVIVHVFELVKPKLGGTVAILGAGPIGMLTAAMAKVFGAEKVWVADQVPHRLELARQMGADSTVLLPAESLIEKIKDETRGRGVDTVFDAAAASSTINQGLSVACPGGAFVLIGLPTEQPLHVDMNIAMDNEIKIQTIKRSNHNDHAALELLESGRIPSAMITHHLPLGQTPRAFEMLSRYEDGVGKIIIEP